MLIIVFCECTSLLQSFGIHLCTHKLMKQIQVLCSVRESGADFSKEVIYVQIY